MDTEVPEEERFEPGDRGRRLVEADRQHRHLGVVGCQRAMAAAAEMATTGEVGELPAACRGEDHVAGVRIAERCLGPRASVREAIEQRKVFLTTGSRYERAVLEE